MEMEQVFWTFSFSLVTQSRCRWKHVSLCFLAKEERKVRNEKSHFGRICIYVVRCWQVVPPTHKCCWTQIAEGKAKPHLMKGIPLIRTRREDKWSHPVHFSLTVLDCSSLQTNVLSVYKYAKFKWQMYLWQSQIYYKAISVQTTVTLVSVRLSPF